MTGIWIKGSGITSFLNDISFVGYTHSVIRSCTCSKAILLPHTTSTTTVEFVIKASSTRHLQLLGLKTSELISINCRFQTLSQLHLTYTRITVCTTKVDTSRATKDCLPVQQMHPADFALRATLLDQQRAGNDEIVRSESLQVKHMQSRLTLHWLTMQWWTKDEGLLPQLKPTRLVHFSSGFQKIAIIHLGYKRNTRSLTNIVERVIFHFTDVNDSCHLRTYSSFTL